MSGSIARRLVFLAATVWLGVQGWNAAPAAAAMTILESSVLRLEVTDAPYSFAVIEKGTGQVLLRHARTTFTVGTAGAASTAAIGAKTATSLEAALALPGSAGTARVRWTFINFSVLRVQLKGGKATSITEAFLDQGERNYGLWEYSYYGTGGALDNRGANNQPLLGLSGPPTGSGDPSGRAPFYLTSRKRSAAEWLLPRIRRRTANRVVRRYVRPST